jgi:peptide/nickel transport system substrate-binding protein/oligopeptide transport system substrate-binding protein
MRKSLCRLTSALIILPLLLSGCSFYNLPDLENHIIENAYQDDAVVYRELYAQEASNLNYLITNAYNDTAICANVIDSLVDYDEYGNILPGLAKSWESNSDMTEWTFHLRDDITWLDYNGKIYSKVVADDWVAAAEYVNNAVNEADCQYMYTAGAVITNAQAYYDYTLYLKNPDAYDTPPAAVNASDIGVKAVDEKTLVFYLDRSCPFFLSVLSYPAFLPVCRKYLKEAGNMFARNHRCLLYNGAYILHYFQPLEKQIMVKNPFYWDKDNVHIDRVEKYYDVDAGSIAAERYMDGSIEKAVVSPDRLEEYLQKPEMVDEIHRPRPDSSFSYFYAFNFDPQFDEKYDPDNWKKAVANENFRKAVMAAIDRTKLLKIYEPYNPEDLVNNTITPPGAVTNNGRDFINYGNLAEIWKEDSYNLTMVKTYRLSAKYELNEHGVKYPIKMLIPYNPATTGWHEEALLLEQMIENALGRNFIDVIVEAGSDTSFLASVRRSGKYAFMKCRWGADYADPKTWTEPFEDNAEYMFWHECQDEGVQAIRKKWRTYVDRASAITTSMDRRLEQFALAEEVVIKHAIVVPFSIMAGDGYVMSKLNEFEGEYSSYGIARQRYKRYYLHEDSMNKEEYEEAYEAWVDVLKNGWK